MMPKTIVADDDPELEDQLRRHPGEHDFVFAHDDAEATRILNSETDLDVALVAIDNTRIGGLDLFRRLGGGGAGRATGWNEGGTAGPDGWMTVPGCRAVPQGAPPRRSPSALCALAIVSMLAGPQHGS